MTYILYKHEWYPTFWVIQTLRIDYFRDILEGEYSKIIIVEESIYNLLKNLASITKPDGKETWYGI